MENPSTIHQWIAEKRDAESIIEELRKRGYDEDSIATYLKEFKVKKHAKRLNTGFICLAIGSLMGFISCVLAILNPIPELHNWFLYGLTSAAMLIIFAGLYLVFE